jgi:hypothetical protein
MSILLLVMAGYVCGGVADAGAGTSAGVVAG